MYSSDPHIARIQAKRDVFTADYDLTKNTTHEYNRLIARQINLLARATNPDAEYQCFERIAAFAALGMALAAQLQIGTPRGTVSLRYPREDEKQEGSQAG